MILQKKFARVRGKKGGKETISKKKHFSVVLDEGGKKQRLE